MASVVDLAGVTIVRGGSTLVDDVTWRIDESDRWVVIGPNGAGKTTLLQVLAAQIHPTSGVAGLLGEVLGTVDVFELRPRIGLTSAALAERIPRGERVHDVVVSASYAVLGRWREALVRTLSELASDPYAPATVLVTHHVEEIPAGITHALLLNRGEVVSAGPLETALTPETLTAAFDLPLSLTRDGDRFAARAL